MLTGTAIECNSICEHFCATNEGSHFTATLQTHVTAMLHALVAW